MRNDPQLDLSMSDSAILRQLHGEHIGDGQIGVYLREGRAVPEERTRERRRRLAIAALLGYYF